MYRVIHAFRRMHAEDPPDFTAALAEACLDIDSVDCGLTVRPQPAPRGVQSAMRGMAMITRAFVLFALCPRRGAADWVHTADAFSAATAQADWGAQEQAQQAAAQQQQQQQLPQQNLQQLQQLQLQLSALLNQQQKAPPLAQPEPQESSLVMNPAELLSRAIPGAPGCSVSIDPDEVQQWSNPNGQTTVKESFEVKIQIPHWQQGQPVTVNFGPGAVQAVINCWNVEQNTAQVAQDHLLFLLGPSSGAEAGEVGCVLEGRFGGGALTTYRGVDCAAPPPPPP